MLSNRPEFDITTIRYIASKKQFQELCEIAMSPELSNAPLKQLESLNILLDRYSKNCFPGSKDYAEADLARERVLVLLNTRLIEQSLIGRHTIFVIGILAITLLILVFDLIEFVF